VTVNDFLLKNVELWKLLGQEARIKILYHLYEGPASWSDLMYSNEINPKSLSSHLTQLIEYDLVRKTSDGYYRITGKGQDVCSLRVFNVRE